MPVVSVSLPDELLARLDRAVAEKGYSSRSELVREALEALLGGGGEEGSTRVIVVVSDHRRHPRVDQRIMEHAYRAAGELLGLYHQVVEGGKCVTVILLREGPAAGALAANIRRTRGVVRVYSITV